MNAVLDRFKIGDWHEADADGCVLVTSDHDLALALGQHLPAKGLRPEPGQSGQVVSVDDDVVKSDRHADSLLGESACHLANPSTSPGILPKGVL
jgi:hypothetical protein